MHVRHLRSVLLHLSAARARSKYKSTLVMRRDVNARFEIKSIDRVLSVVSVSLRQDLECEEQAF